MVCVSFVKQFYEIIDGKNITKIEVKKGDQLFYIKKYGLSEMGCYLRIGSSCKSLMPEEIKERFIKSLSNITTSVVDIPSRKSHPTVQILEKYHSKLFVSFLDFKKKLAYFIVSYFKIC